MKHIKLSLVSALLLLFTSCTGDWLDVYPSTSVETGQAITTEKDAQIALNGLYRILSAHGYYADNYIYYADVRGMDVQCRTNVTSNRGYSYYTFSDQASDAATVLTWSQPYIVIRQANNLIAQADAGNISGTPEIVARIKAETLAIRGLALFDLTRFFGRPYTEDNGASLGVPIQLKAEGVENKPARNTVAECYAQVIKDMTTALPALSTAKTNGFLNQWAVKGLLSRVYLYMGDNQNAFNYAAEVIKDSPYTLWTNAEYASVWGQDFSSESLFELIYNTTENSGGESTPMVYAQNGYNALVLTQEYLDMLQSDPLDVRAGFTGYEREDDGKGHLGAPITTGARKYLMKYPGKTQTDPRDNNICVIRLSELYLTASETAFKLNNTNALSYLNAIVSRANPAKSVSQADLSLDRILLERRKELVGEGHAFFDLVRNHRNIVRLGGWQQDLGTDLATVLPTDKRIILPIPQAEMDANENMVQN